MIVADAPFASEARLAAIRGASSSAAAMVLEQASAMIRTYCDWHIWPSRPETLTVPGRGAAVLSLPTLHITEITSVTADGVALTEGTSYAVDFATSSIAFAGFTWPYTSIVVAMVHGFPEPLADLEALTIGLAARLLASGKVSGATSTQVGQVSVSYGAPGLADHERWLLDRYALHRRP